MQEQAVLQSVENDRRITKEQDADFLYLLQNAFLLALKESGRLNEMQYRYAEENLNTRRKENAVPENHIC